MKILIDTNVMIDYLINREPFSGAAAKLIGLCDNTSLVAFITANTVADIYYVVRKVLGDKKAREVIEPFAYMYCVDLRYRDVMKAFKSPIKDYEDAMLSECALSLDVDYIITRDINDFSDSHIPAMMPDAFLSEYYPDA